MTKSRSGEYFQIHTENMIQQISSFKIGDQFKIGGEKFGNIYKGRIFTVDKVAADGLSATATFHTGASDGVEYHFCQANFDYYGKGVMRLGEKNDKEF